MSVTKAYKEMSYGLAPENDAEANDWLGEHGRRFGHFINNRWRKSKRTFPAHNPATGEKLASLPAASQSDVDAAVRAARGALDDWEKIGCHGRARYLYALARAVQKHSRLFATLESLDNGKPIRESRDIDVPLVARHFYYHAGWAQLRDETYSDYESVGVVGQIIPWNFPLLMLAWKVAPALAMGNTVVLKPAEDTSLTALLFAEICEQVDLPPGVFNLVLGKGDVGEKVAGHNGIDKVAFTGSTVVGRYIRRQIAGSGKKLSLELGGKSPYIVFEDADIDSAVEGLVDAIWFNQGQVCCAGSRLLVQESIAEKFLAKTKRRMSKLIVGGSLDKNTDIGAIVSQVQLKRITSLVKQGAEEGGQVWQPECSLPKGGAFFPPTLISRVEPSATLAQEEIFGPVLIAMEFRTPAEAVSLANNTRYGLAANIWTENINEALHVAAHLKAGTVWVNSANSFDASVGFGGYRESGFGREGGPEGLHEYLKPRIDANLSNTPAEEFSSRSKAAVIAHSIDRTPKQYIGGKQVRPDSGYSADVLDAAGNLIANVPKGNRKDIRNAVEAASGNPAWSTTTGHARAQVLYFLAENLEYRREEFAGLISSLSGKSSRQATTEVDVTLDRIFSYAAYTDKYEGSVHLPDKNRIAIAMKEPYGVLAVAAPEESPLLGLMSTTLPGMAMGNRIVVVPSERYSLVATHLYQVLETSDVPPGAFNIVVGDRDELINTLSGHADVDAMWCWDSPARCELVERNAAENMKRTWVSFGKYRNWFSQAEGSGEDFLRHAVEIKNIWVPYGI